MNKILPLLLIISIANLTSCSQQLSDYQRTTPVLDIKQFFNGQLTAWGMVENYNQQVTRRFCVEIDGKWHGDNGQLVEVFYFDDGEISHRTWQLTRLDDGRYQGQAADVIGMAQGQQKGFAFQWQYQLAINIDGENYHFDLDDWMYQIDQYRLFNRTKMSKLGIEVAQITLFFDKQTRNACHTMQHKI